MNQRKTILFDVDGVLIDTMPIWESSANLYLKDMHGIDAPLEVDKNCMSLSLVEAGEYLLRLYPQISMTPREIADEVAAYIREKYIKAPEKPHMVETVRKLKEMGYTMYLVTASEEENVEGALTNLGVWDCFENIYTCTAIGYSKSYPAFFEEVARRIGKPFEEMVMVEDSLHSMKTAKQVGLEVVALYEASSEAYTEEIKKTCDVYLECIDALPEWLTTLR